jgi:peptide deformylase
MQHEIDHLNGIYFFERLSPIRKTLAAGKLKRIARGDIEPAYEIVRG